MENPIIENRVVNDITFAIRFKNFIKDVKVFDLPSTEEKEYLLGVADKLLQYQLDTVDRDSEEEKYLGRIKLYGGD